MSASDVNVEAEIQELNLSYLLLAQRLLKEDPATARFRLKIGEELAELIVSLSARQLARLARTNQLLFRPCLEEVAQLEKVVNNERDQGLSQTHAALLLASVSPEQPDRD